MDQVFKMMVDNQKHQLDLGCEVILWKIRTDQFPTVEADAREAGQFDDKSRTILGVPFEVGDRVASEGALLAMDIGPKR